MMKFWNAASWSNLSAQMPAMMPSAPRMPPPNTANAQSPERVLRPARHEPSGDEQARRRPPPSRAPPLPAHTPRNVSNGDSGVSSTKMMLPVILDWIRLEELLANAFCSSDIMARPGHQERGVRDARIDLHARLQGVREDQQIQERGEDRRSDGLKAHLPEAQQLLV